MSDYEQCVARFEAFGSLAVLAVTEGSALRVAREAVDETVSAFDLACSRFRDDSELSALNRAEGRPVIVGELLIDAVQAALRAARLTDGNVDPTVGEALIALGYDRDFGELERAGSSPPSLGPIRIVAVPGWRAVGVDASARTIRIPRGVKLDLGATAKALAADRAAEAAAAAAGCGVLVSFGGDISLAGDAAAEGWRVRVTDDHRADFDAPGQWIMLRAGGLATSSTSARRWQGPLGAAHHLLDPATGQPVRGRWRTVTVAARSCLDANTASTAAIVRDQRAPSWLAAQGLPTRLVSVGGEAVYVGGWPRDGDDLAPHHPGAPMEAA